MFNARTLLLALLPSLFASALAAQRPGRVVGRVIDAETGKGIADAGVQIVGTTLGASTTIDGQYTIGNVVPGTITVQVRRLGYRPKTVTGLQLSDGGVLEQVVTLSQAVARVAAQIVTATAERGSVESALDEQRTATQVVNSVTAEQISRSPDANAAQAIQRVAGVSVQDGKYVMVRGLGERYTTTALNGARLPSPEPERKMVPLDLFPSGLIQSVTTSKTFTPDLPGDFSGAHVDIKTREFPAERQTTYGVSIGATQGTIGRNLPFAPGVGGESFALAGGDRDLPAGARAAGNFSGLSQAQRNEIINSFRNVWRAGSRDARPNMSARMSVGGNEPMLGRRVGYLLSGTYSYSQDSRDQSTRALVGPGGAEMNRFSGPSTGESVLWGGLLSASTLFGQHSRVTTSAIYNRSADNDARIERGVIEETGLPMEIEQLNYIERSVWSTQLAGEHQSGIHALDWSVTGSGVMRAQPDRSELGYVVDGSGGIERKLWDFSGEGAVRTFSELDEKAVEGKAAYRIEVGPLARRTIIKVGGLGRGTARDVDVRVFAISALSMEDSVRALPPEELFGGRFTAPDSAALTLRSLAQGGAYTADDALGAGFAMVDVPVLSWMRLIGGARVETNQTTVRSLSTNGDRSRIRRDYVDVLPSLALNIRPSDAHTVRLSASRTLARPEYREISDVRTRDASHSADQRGNPALVRTLIDNLDLRYEFYPRRGEVLSAALFLKRFQNPIERVYDITSGKPVTTWVNAAGADNLGVELEARTSLDFVADWLTPVTAFSSITVMRSEIDLGPTASTNTHRAMVGQSPHMINAGLTYASASGRGSATLLFNRVGTRIAEAGVTPFPDAKELARDLLDLSVRWPVGNGLTARMDAKNLLNTPYLMQQGTVIRERYLVGRALQMGLTLQR